MKQSNKFLKILLVLSVIIFYSLDPCLAYVPSTAQIRYLEYYPFGEVRTEVWGSGPNANKPVKHRFNSKELDESTGFYDYGARQYDAILQRFISADPLDWKKEIESDGNIDANEISDKVSDFGLLGNPQNLNRYSYARNNPLVLTDSSGLKVEKAQYEVYYSGEYHNFWRLIPDNPSDFKNNNRFYKNAGGQLETTISGGPNILGKLVSKPNADRYEIPSSAVVVPTPQGKTDTQAINNLLTTDSQYKNDLSYHLFPDGKQGKYNSNSHFSGIGKAAGYNNIPSLPNDANSPGLNKPIPISKTTAGIVNRSITKNSTTNRKIKM